jgi:hypothetical protein
LFQIMIDLLDIHTLNALYISLSIGMTLKFFWAWNVKYSFLDSLSEPANAKMIHPLFFYRKKSHLNNNLILTRIVKKIRRKKYSQDDSEGPISFCFSQPF